MTQPLQSLNIIQIILFSHIIPWNKLQPQKTIFMQFIYLHVPNNLFETMLALINNLKIHLQWVTNPKTTSISHVQAIVPVFCVLSMAHANIFVCCSFLNRVVCKNSLGEKQIKKYKFFQQKLSHATLNFKSSLLKWCNIYKYFGRFIKNNIKNNFLMVPFKSDNSVDFHFSICLFRLP